MNTIRMIFSRVASEMGGGYEVELAVFRLSAAGYPALEAVRAFLGSDAGNGRYAPFAQKLRGVSTELVAWGPAADKLFAEGGSLAVPVGRVEMSALLREAREQQGDLLWMRHVTPAVFRRYGRYVAVPVEGLYLSRPAAVWGALTGEEVRPVVEVVEASVREVPWRLGKDGIVVPGFVGRVLLRVADPTHRAVALLARWTGVGAKTAWGMGEVAVECAGKI